MEIKSRFHKSSLYDEVFLLKKLIFGYVWPIFNRGFRNNGLEFNDLYRCSKDDEAEKILTRLKKNWNLELRRSNPRLWRALLRTFGLYMFLLLFIYIFEECFLRVVQPLLLGRVIRYFSGDEQITYSDACWSATGVTACTIFFVSCHHPTMLQAMRCGMRMRISCCSLMYQKALKLSRASVNQTAVGQIINIMSNDVNRMDEFTIFINYIIVGPLQLFIVVYILYQYLQWSCFVGIALLFLFIPFQAVMGRLFSRIRLKTAILTDTRLRFMNEIISGIRVIKMYCWESPFAKRVADARSAEVKCIRQSCYLKAINLSVFFVATRIILFVCFITYVLTGNQLTSEGVFVSMALLNALRLTVTFFFPQAISLGSELSITLKRIENFLLLEEMSTLSSSTSSLSSSLSSLQINTNNKRTLNNDKKKKNKNENHNNYDDNNPLMKNKKEQSGLLDSKLSLTGSVGEQPQPIVIQPKLIINNIVAKWSPNIIEPTLKNISARLKPGDLLAVIGPVGSGKSSLIMAILRELPLISGQIDIDGLLSYASQDPWSFNESVRNNILFGKKFDQKKYDDVIKVCALERDLTLMPFGDKTLVGEKGVSLSGGQKARINLARAIYRDSDIFLLDDPLSAVDTAVAEHIFEKCIMEYLKTKIRILVTHQIQFIQKATKILILQQGTCLAYGTFNELQQMGIDFMSILKENDKKSSNDSSGGGEKQELDRTISLEESSLSLDGISKERKLSYSSLESSGSLTKLNDRPRTLSTGEECFQVDTISYHDDDDDNNYCLERKSEANGIRKFSNSMKKRKGNENDKEKGGGDNDDEPKIVEEQFQRGSIKGKVYLEYIKAGSTILTLLIAILFTIASQTIFNGSDIFLTSWTNKNQAKPISDEEQKSDITIYSILIISLFITTIIRSISFFIICMKASETLHNQIFERLLRAKISFFDTNPVGRILNRFTKDLGIIDEMLPNTAYDLNLTLSSAVGVVVTVSIVSWYLVIPAIFLTIIIVFIRWIYIKSARDIKRLEGMARSPVYSHVSTTINGLASIRAFGLQKEFEKQFYIYQNDHSATWFLFISTSRCMGLVIDWISSAYIAIISLVVMVSKDMPGGNAGLAISSGLMLAGMTQWGVRQSAEFESQMTSVERIVEYQDLDKEPPRDSEPGKKPPKEWPTEGNVQFDHMFLRYPNSEKPVLKDINCTIYGGEKIGIVGRTGAGKSSMIAALFRLTETTGTIRIDGIDIKSIGLDDLRKKISIIPQDPVVFTGSVRYNLDPFNEHEENFIWKALDEVQLKDQVNNYQGKLDSLITESGSNLSVGQRQLICLARAILKNNKVLVLDEATANVDHQTDSLIQNTIREKFRDCTVLTIAHRLNTIIDCDRVMVLQAGQIIEFDIPYFLLRQRGLFYDMCKKTGPAMFSNLYQLAKITHKNKLRESLSSPNVSSDNSNDNSPLQILPPAPPSTPLVLKEENEEELNEYNEYDSHNDANEDDHDKLSNKSKQK